MISLKVVVLLLLVHWLADFVLQTHQQATNKSTSTEWLTAHVLTYTFCMGILSYVLFDNLISMMLFTGITFGTHWGTDYITSRLGKPFWENKDFHNGFVVVGADQVIHYLCLFGAYKLLS